MDLFHTYKHTTTTHTHPEEKKTNTKTKRHKPVRTIRLVSQSLLILLPYIYDPVIHLPCPCAYSACLFVATLIAITIIIIITEDRFVIYIYFALHRPFSLSLYSPSLSHWVDIFIIGFFSVSVFNFFIFSRLVCLCTWQEYIKKWFVDISLTIWWSSKSLRKKKKEKGINRNIRHSLIHVSTLLFTSNSNYWSTYIDRILNLKTSAIYFFFKEWPYWNSTMLFLLIGWCPCQTRPWFI